MSTTHASPDLDHLLESVARRLPHDALEDLAALRPPFDEVMRDELAVEVARVLQAKAKAALEDAKAGPLPDEPEFNEATKQVLREAREGKGLVRSESWDALFADLGM